MTSLILSWQNWCDLAATTVTSSSEVTTLPASRLKEPQIRRRWRTGAGVTAANVTFDFGSNKSIGVIAYAQPDDCGGIDGDGNAIGWLASTDQVYHRLDLVAPPVGAVFDSGFINGGWAPGHGFHSYLLATPQTARYLKTGIVAGSLIPTPNYFDMGRAWAGPAWEPSLNISFGWSWAFEDQSIVARNPRSGLEFVDQGPRTKVLTFGFENLTSTDVASIRELQRIAGLGKQVLCIPRPGDANVGTESIIGRLTQIQPITEPNFYGFAAAFQIRQSL